MLGGRVSGEAAMNILNVTTGTDRKRQGAGIFKRPRSRFGGLRSLGKKARYHRDQEVCGQSQPAQYFYEVLEGVVRRYVVRSNGHRQIVDLLLPGDFCGLTTEPEHDSTIEAVMEGTVVAAYLRRNVEAVAETDQDIARGMRELAFASFFRLQNQLLIVGRVTAVEKVGAFLLEMMARLPEGQEDEIILPVSRYDMADYLALSVETVSRALSDLKSHGIISLIGTRHVKIIDKHALEAGNDPSLNAAH
jgi:CRP/FNR family transcriptional regulator, nitrogen fixation regulation protein